MAHFIIEDRYRRYFAHGAYSSLFDALNELGITQTDCWDRSNVFERILQSEDGSMCHVHVKVYRYTKSSLKRLLRPLKTDIEIRGLERFRALGISAPSLVAQGCYCGVLGVPEYECLVTETVPAAGTLETYLATLSADVTEEVVAAQRMCCIKKLAMRLRILHESNYFHRDLYLRNILVKTGSSGELELVWFDSPRGIQTHIPFFRRHCLVRDIASVAKNLCRSEYPQELRTFLRNYLGQHAPDSVLYQWQLRVESYIQRRWPMRNSVPLTRRVSSIQLNKVQHFKATVAKWWNSIMPGHVLQHSSWLDDVLQVLSIPF